VPTLRPAAPWVEPQQRFAGHQQLGDEHPGRESGVAAHLPVQAAHPGRDRVVVRWLVDHRRAGPAPVPPMSRCARAGAGQVEHLHVRVSEPITVRALQRCDLDGLRPVTDRPDIVVLPDEP
jgi:hypothetical protein